MGLRMAEESENLCWRLWRHWVNKTVSVGILVVFRIAATWCPLEATYRKEIYSSLQFHGGKIMVLFKVVDTTPVSVAGAWGILFTPPQPTKKQKGTWRLDPTHDLLPLIRLWLLKTTQTPRQLYQLGLSIQTTSLYTISHVNHNGVDLSGLVHDDSDPSPCIQCLTCEWTMKTLTSS